MEVDIKIEIKIKIQNRQTKKLWEQFDKKQKNVNTVNRKKSKITAYRELSAKELKPQIFHVGQIE